MIISPCFLLEKDINMGVLVSGEIQILFLGDLRLDKNNTLQIVL